jgi:hypothetical protein
MEEAPPWAEDRKSSGPIPMDSLLATTREEGGRKAKLLPCLTSNFAFRIVEPQPIQREVAAFYLSFSYSYL